MINEPDVFSVAEEGGGWGAGSETGQTGTAPLCLDAGVGTAWWYSLL